MDNQPIIIHIAAMLADFEEGPLRAAYMVVKQLHELQRTHNENSTKMHGKQQK